MDAQVRASTIIDHLSVVHRQLALAMKGHWLGPMPIEEFLQEFLLSLDKPLPTVLHNKLQRAAMEHSKALWCDSFIDAIKDWIPNLRAINTSQKGDQDSKPDVCLYDSSKDVPLDADFNRLELWIVFKRGSQHIAFQDPKEPSSTTIKSGAFIPETKAAQETCWQLLDYAGAIVSSAFQYHEHPEILAKVLWQFNHLSAKDWGHDTSVCPVVLQPDVAKSVRESLDIPDTEQLLDIIYLG
ncbi:hypothetical protein EV363DRAFT_1332075 [Boletus edulis]|nr:hypothetical protein EV363DRAFT_1332075 [Boletus edulis]